MKSKVSWKPLGHSAKRWHDNAFRKDSPVPFREARPPKKKGAVPESMWK